MASTEADAEVGVPPPPPPFGERPSKGAERRSQWRPFFGIRRGRDLLEPYLPLIREIGSRETGFRRADDAALREAAADLREHARAGDSLDEMLVTSFALAREVCRRTLGMRPYDVQIAGGIALHRGAVVEMQTGEGKTLAAVAPVFLNALSGRGAHVLTFNDYLARRDAAWMGPAYRFLGLSVGFVQEGMTVAARQDAYRRDVTYLTAKEAGFDLLRDGLCLDRSDQVHRPLHFALVDEADSILIDEARIPLVIAGASDGETVGLARLAVLARGLEPGRDYETDEYARNIFLTERGTARVERRLDCGSLFDPGNTDLLAAVRNALHAEALLRRDVDYIVRDGAIELVDEFTGRVAENRHWPDGLQAAVEAKEGLRLGADGRILGSITLQHFLGLYPKLCGMTATARPAAEELAEFYGLDVEEIPSNRPCIRVDHSDLIYTHREARDRAVAVEVSRAHAAGRPVLAGTVSVAESERLAARLRDEGVPCEVLNAKNDEKEAAIVAEAGAVGAVTISTNMAGRGTDIRLGGREERDRDRVVALGGLYVIGTNRHESRRIDRQLRGRAGRQGDPGSSRFFISLEDDLPRRYRIEKLIPHRLFPRRSDSSIDSRVVRREVHRVQRIVEGQTFDIRKRLTSYSEIIEKQRRSVHEWRQDVLEERADPRLLAERLPERWTSVVHEVGIDVAQDVERRLTLLGIDRCWGEYLEEMQAIRDEIHLVLLVGKTPLAEFYRTAIHAYERLIRRIDDWIVTTFQSLEITRDGVDWNLAGLRGPSATWTYLVSDNVFSSNLLMTMANRPTFAVWAVMLHWPLLFAWGLYLRWKKWRAARADP